eukprot:1698203-Amphidinium_carterae.1
MESWLVIVDVLSCSFGSRSLWHCPCRSKSGCCMEPKRKESRELREMFPMGICMMWYTLEPWILCRHAHRLLGQQHHPYAFGGIRCWSHRIGLTF